MEKTTDNPICLGEKQPDGYIIRRLYNRCKFYSKYYMNKDYLYKWDIIWGPVWVNGPKFAIRFPNIQSAHDALDTARVLMRPIPWCIPDYGDHFEVDIV